MHIPALEQLELSSKVLFDGEGRRVPVIRLRDDDTEVLRLEIRPDWLTVQLAEILEYQHLGEIIQVLQWVQEQAPTITAPPPPNPKATPPSTKPKKPPAKKLKPSLGRGGSGERPDTPLPHRSHYPPEVFQASPPPPVEGGYPKDLGMWRKFGRSQTVDEYGRKDVLQSTD